MGRGQEVLRRWGWKGKKRQMTDDLIYSNGNGEPMRDMMQQHLWPLCVSERSAIRIDSSPMVATGEFVETVINSMDWVWTLVLRLPSCVLWGKLFSISVPQFSQSECLIIPKGLGIQLPPGHRRPGTLPHGSPWGELEDSVPRVSVPWVLS